MPSLTSLLDDLVRIPSVVAPGFPRDPLLRAHQLVAKHLQRAGVYHIETLELPGAPPAIVCEITPPVGAPMVLLYGHYDVAPAGAGAGWTSPPFAPTERGGAIFGRGTSQAKSNLVVHLGALEAWEGRPPVGVRVVVDGEGEVGESALSRYVRAHPERFGADAVLTASPHASRAGLPIVTTAARGTGADRMGPACQAAVAAVSETWGRAPVTVTGTAPSPALVALGHGLPSAEVIGLGPTSRRFAARAANECLVLDAFERTIVAEAKFFRELSDRVR